MSRGVASGWINACQGLSFLDRKVETISGQGLVGGVELDDEVIVKVPNAK